ncbi:hypothetical protein ACFOY4_12790 [Actinomadura syzygii]|nr:hypothetical protein [Actinomadura syzygii]
MEGAEGGPADGLVLVAAAALSPLVLAAVIGCASRLHGARTG